MKNVIKILAALICAVMVISLAACGGNENTNSTSSVSDTASGKTEAKQPGSEDSGGGKVVFGDDTDNPEDTTEKTDDSEKEPVESSKSADSAESTGDDSSDTSEPSGGDSSETADPSGDNGGTSSETTESGGNGDYGGIQWND